MSCYQSCQIFNGRCIYYGKRINGVDHKCILKQYAPNCNKTKALSDRKRGVRGIEDFTCPPECDYSVSQQLEGDLFYVETSDSQDGPVIDGPFPIEPGDTLRFWSAGGIQAMGEAGSALIQLEPNNILSSNGAPSNPPQDPTRPVIYLDSSTNKLYNWIPESIDATGGWSEPISGGNVPKINGALSGDFLIGTQSTGATGTTFINIRPCEVEYHISQDTQTVEDLANIDNSYLVNRIGSICNKTSLANILTTSFKDQDLPICQGTGALDNTSFFLYEGERNHICQENVKTTLNRYIDHLPTEYSSPFDPPIDGQSTEIISKVTSTDVPAETEIQTHTFNDILRYYASSLPQSGTGSPPGGVNVGDMWIDTSGGAPRIRVRIA